MMKIKYLFFILFSILLIGCAAGKLSQGDQYLKSNNFDAAIKHYLVQLKSSPQDAQDAKVWRQLGIAYYKNQDFEKGLNALQKAIEINDADPKTQFYLGAVYEELGNFEQAVAYLKRSAYAKDVNKIDPGIAAKLDVVTRKHYAAQAKYAIQNEQYLTIQQPEENSIAVLYFENVGQSEDLTPLQKGLADMVITDLSQIDRLKVVERVQLQKLLEEIGLAQSGLVDPATSPRVGKLLGAAQLVQGSFLDVNSETIKMEAGLLETTSGRSTKAQDVSGDLEKIFRLEKDLVFNVLSGMGIRPTDTERKAIMEVPTENLLAFLAYSKGLDFEDRGNFEAARGQYQQAVSLDPNFNKAVQQQQKVEKIETGGDIGEYEPAETAEPAMAAGSTRSRMENSMTKIDAGFIPSTDPGEPVSTSNLRKPLEEQTGTQSFGGVPVLIEIQLPE